METDKGILRSVDFHDLYEVIQKIFTPYFNDGSIMELLKMIKILAEANFQCYQANMKVIAERKKKDVDLQVISNGELTARTVGEKRVLSKSEINQYISEEKHVIGLNREELKPNSVWLIDDVIYSIGEMLDRLTIEYIKRVDFISKSENANQYDMKVLGLKVNSSYEWSWRVERYLKKKLVEINNKGFYECVDEMRTYEIKGE
jgi:hypothetical protein